MKRMKSTTTKKFYFKHDTFASSTESYKFMAEDRRKIEHFSILQIDIYTHTRPGNTERERANIRKSDKINIKHLLIKM